MDEKGLHGEKQNIELREVLLKTLPIPEKEVWPAMAHHSKLADLRTENYTKPESLSLMQ